MFETLHCIELELVGFQASYSSCIIILSFQCEECIWYLHLQLGFLISTRLGLEIHIWNYS